LPNASFSQKRWVLPIHSLDPCYARLWACNGHLVPITSLKLAIPWTKVCLGTTTTHLGQAKWVVRGKKRQAARFVLPAIIRTRSLFVWHLWPTPQPHLGTMTAMK
jgi:hypothetical protein